MNVYKQLGSLANEANSLSSLPSGRHLKSWLLGAPFPFYRSIIADYL